MYDFSPSYLADLMINISWQERDHRHNECYFAKDFNFYRDVFPGSRLEEVCKALHDKDTVTVHVEPGCLVPEYSPKKVFVHPLSRVDMADPRQLRVNRCYPRQILKGVAGIFKGNRIPFRVADINDTCLSADFNHPLSQKAFDLECTLLNTRIGASERGGACTDWLELALDGPGIQASAFDGFSRRIDTLPFARKDEERDTAFYSVDRMVPHIDGQASENLAGIYGKYLCGNDAVLDLMAGWQSHLPEGVCFSRVAGLGMNIHEMNDNSDLTDAVVRDLNETPVLPYDTGTFDQVICSLSVEYLTRPVEVFKEVARVLKPGGRFIVSFSNRWFPEKTIRIWEDLHEFERVGLVMAFFAASKKFTTVDTWSVRGYPRPLTDRHIGKTRMSDPVYVVTATKSTAGIF